MILIRTRRYSVHDASSGTCFPSDRRIPRQYHGHAVSEPGEQLDDFYLANRRWGVLKSGPHGYDAVWMSCTAPAGPSSWSRPERKVPSPTLLTVGWQVSDGVVAGIVR